MFRRRPPLYTVSVGCVAVGVALIEAHLASGWTLGTWGLMSHLAALLLLVGVVGSVHFRTSPPSCWALEAVQERLSAIPKSVSHKGGQPMWGWAAVRNGALLWLASGMLRQRLFRRERLSPPAPSAPLCSPAELPPSVLRPPGQAAHWDPWRQSLVLGQAWSLETVDGARILAHELAHAGQPRWRLLLADGWVKGMLVMAALGAGFLSGWVWWPETAAVLTFVGDAGWRWPLEAEADREAARSLADQAGPDVGQWAAELTPRHRVLLALESLQWAVGAFLVVWLVRLLGV